MLIRLKQGVRVLLLIFISVAAMGGRMIFPNGRGEDSLSQCARQHQVLTSDCCVVLPFAANANTIG